MIALDTRAKMRDKASQREKFQQTNKYNPWLVVAFAKLYEKTVNFWEGGFSPTRNTTPSFGVRCRKQEKKTRTDLPLQCDPD